MLLVKGKEKIQLETILPRPLNRRESRRVGRILQGEPSTVYRVVPVL